MRPILLSLAAVVFLSSAAPAQAIPSSPYQCLTLRSDGQSGIKFTAASAPSIPLSNAAFTPADFAAACGGQPAAEVPPYPVWCPSLLADPAAKWIGIDSAGTPRSALYCQTFAVPACGVQAASIRFSFCVDDWIGDPPNGPNQLGVFLNGQPIPGFGGLGSQVTWSNGNIAPLLVGGTNQLQVYVRDNGAGITGVMYSATLCYVGCRTDEVVRLRSGNGAMFGPDSQVTVLAGAPSTALSTSPANLALAASSPPAAIVAPLPQWCPSLSVDAQAQWIATTQGYGPGSAIYSHSFSLQSCSILSASLSIACSVSSTLGDPAGTPSVGLFLNQNALPLSLLNGLGGSACNLNFAASIPPAWLNGSGPNTLSVYVRDLGQAQNGVLYSATLTVRPCPPGSQVIDLRSGNGNLGQSDAVIRYVAGPSSTPLSNSTFNGTNFAAAASGPAAYIGQNFQWCPALTQDAQAKWVSTSPLLGPSSALYSHPFAVSLCRSDIKRATLVLHYCADDGLGDPAGGGPNPMGLYLNGIPVPGTAGDISTWPGTNIKTITVGNVAPYLLSGQNVLSLYVRDRNNGISGVLYSARIVVSPCDWYYYGEPCGQTVPNTLFESVPVAGGSVEYRVRGDSLVTPQYLAYFMVFGVSNEVGPAGLPLPLDLGLAGAPGCQLTTSDDLDFVVISDALGNANLSIAVPPLPVFFDLPIFAQTFVYDGVSNPLGISATRGIAVDIRRP